ncbi:DEAD/DEAH box helicase family protein [Winogradskyella sediminis]|uniref:DEAD/DEAH box helicase family protein n=1 Tax=Winogradskyella sediminis TaxID=1382466 RepID=UPI003AA8E1A2
MLKRIKWADDRGYKTGSEDEPFQFYLDALCNSNTFDLLLGYFSSSAINLLSLGFANFIYNGGKVRMIINNILSEQDKIAVKNGLEGNVIKNQFDLSNITKLQHTLKESDKHFFECLAWLINNNRITIKIIQPIGGKGISHYKSGVFGDGNNKVGFKASCNFTAYGLLENLEELDCHLSWEDPSSNKRIKSLTDYFDRIYSGNADFVDYLNPDDILISIQKEFGNKTINELLISEKDLITKKNKLLGNPKVRKSLKAAQKKIEDFEESEQLPHFPRFDGKISEPREYQVEAYDKWLKNNSKGIFAMATGTGKTITSLNCLLEESRKNNNIYQALILVPTITLVNQWEEEAKSFNFNYVIKVSSKNPWENELSTLLSMAKRVPTSFIIISTYASFIRERFNKYLSKLPKETLFIADEAHNVGSRSVLEKLDLIKCNKRIGLSATPKRVYDEVGSETLEKFFNDKEPYTYGFSMNRAIEENILCKYEYYPHIVSLTKEELENYIEITKKISRCTQGADNNPELSAMLERLLLIRKQIIHKAENKLPKTISILKERFQNDGDLKYTFIYVPEGNTYELNEDENEDDDNIRIINQYTREIGKIDRSIMVNQFIGGMKDRDEVLNQFKEGDIHVIASMKCLDEGVDIPRAEHAVFCSSTGNPRQFIQRRGRILRKHKDKHFAVIHDLVVVPDLTQSDLDSDTIKVERKMVEKELERVMYFASLSKNPDYTEEVFNEICDHYGLNIYTIYNEIINV